MSGTFRLKTPQSHTRFEGKDRKERAMYFGPGHPRARNASGDLIYLEDQELERFGDEAYERFELIDGDWHKPPVTASKEDAVAESYDKYDRLLANKIEVIEGELAGYDVDELQAIRDLEEGSHKPRKGVLAAIDELLEELS